MRWHFAFAVATYGITGLLLPIWEARVPVVASRSGIVRSTEQPSLGALAPTGTPLPYAALQHPPAAGEQNLPLAQVKSPWSRLRIGRRDPPRAAIALNSPARGNVRLLAVTKRHRNILPLTGSDSPRVRGRRETGRPTWGAIRPASRQNDVASLADVTGVMGNLAQRLRCRGASVSRASPDTEQPACPSGQRAAAALHRCRPLLRLRGGDCIASVGERHHGPRQPSLGTLACPWEGRCSATALNIHSVAALPLARLRPGSRIGQASRDHQTAGTWEASGTS
jgi:hypothetical protein